MADNGIDTTDRTLTGKTLKAAGYEFACRYVLNAPGPNHIDKQMTAAEVREKSAAAYRSCPTLNGIRYRATRSPRAKPTPGRSWMRTPSFVRARLVSLLLLGRHPRRCRQLRQLRARLGRRPGTRAMRLLRRRRPVPRAEEGRADHFGVAVAVHIVSRQQRPHRRQPHPNRQWAIRRPRRRLQHRQIRLLRWLAARRSEPEPAERNRCGTHRQTLQRPNRRSGAIADRETASIRLAQRPVHAPT